MTVTVKGADQSYEPGQAVVNLAEGEIAAPVDLPEVAETFASIRLVATDPAGAPVAGADVRVGGTSVGVTDAQGVYVLAEQLVGSKVTVGRGTRIAVRSSEGGGPVPALAVLFGPVEEYEGDGRRVIDVRTGELCVDVPLGDDGEEATLTVRRKPPAPAPR